MDPFKAYDIRGIYPYEVDEDFAYHLGTSLHKVLDTDVIVVGRDGRNSSDALFESVTKGILDSGKNVLDIGQCSTPQFYFILYTKGLSGIMITASHNPKEYNGFKICSSFARPIFIENGLLTLKDEMKHPPKKHQHKGELKTIQIEKYSESFEKFQENTYKPFHILIDTGNGMGTYEVNALRQIYDNNLHLEVLYEDVNGDFPNHECNPVKEKEYTTLIKKLQTSDYDFGIAMDGDADRVCFYTKEGLIPPDIITGLLGVEVTKEGDKVAYEVRSSQAVPKFLEKNKRVPLLYKSGHAYIKEAMRKDNVVFAGEKSGHYFYQKLYTTDSPLLTIIEMFNVLNREKKSLSELVKPLLAGYENSGEVNYTVKDPDKVLAKIKEEFKDHKVLEIDGISVYGDDFFFNIRKSNTEPLVRLNIEAHSKSQVERLKTLIEKVLSRY